MAEYFSHSDAMYLANAMTEIELRAVLDADAGTISAVESICHYAVSFSRPEPSGSCVYFLYKLGQLVYIGQTNELNVRYFDHLKHKDFDDVRFIRLPSEVLLIIEWALIEHLKPPLNKPIRIGAEAVKLRMLRLSDALQILQRTHTIRQKA